MSYSFEYNPFDFANPVVDKEFFAGREQELDEILYYLHQAKSGKNPINIAILGNRASGKTSLLNISELEAKNKKYCTVRINLDENDSRNELSFFYKIFSEVLTAACRMNAFEGIDGRTYETYLDMISTFEIPQDRTFCTFMFPFQYAKAMSVQNVNMSVLDDNFKRDLCKIRDELNCPIIIFFDEVNVLANSRPLLQKLRNIFMNIQGYMLVFSGTPDLFPVMDDVFSPIVRQFKKINISGFKSWQETQNCIFKRLDSIGIKPLRVIDLNTVKEIHELSAGKPYEIQLICHFLFRRMEQKKAKKMEFALTVLEDIREELETTQDVSKRPLLQQIKYLSNEDLKALNLLCRCEGRANFNQLWSVEYLFAGHKNWTIERLNTIIERLISKNVIRIENEIISFRGDEFDKLYVKYFARQKKIALQVSSQPLEVFFDIRFYSFVDPIKTFEINRFYPPGIESQIDINEIIEKMVDPEVKTDIFAELPAPVVDTIYWLMVNSRDKEFITSYLIKFEAAWIERNYLVQTKSEESLMQIINELNKRGEEVGFKVGVKKNVLDVIKLDKMSEMIKGTANERLRIQLSVEHYREMVNEYIHQKDIEMASFHARLVGEYNKDLPSEQMNNVGYILMNAENYDLAKQLFEKSITIAMSLHEKALPNYNLGVLEAQLGNYENSLEKMKSCIDLLNMDKKALSCARLIKVNSSHSILEFNEVEEVDLLEIAQYSKDTLQQHLINASLSN